MNTVTARRRRARTVLPVLALALTAALAGCGSEDSTATGEPTSPTSPTSPSSSSTADAVGITVEDPWVRATTGTTDPSMTAAFMTIDNDTDSEVVLESASSPVAGMVQIHEMVDEGGTMVMQEAEGGITLKPHGGQLLQPGGYHVMLMDLAKPLKPSAEVALTLTFSDGTTIDVTAPVKEFTEEEGHYHSPWTEEHSH